MKKFKDFVAHLFAPRESNDYRARTLHHDFLAFYLALALLFSFSVRHLGGGLSNVLGLATDITTQKLLILTNDERDKFGLGKLNYNKKLSEAARRKALDMFTKNYWAHYAPDGTTPWNFMREVEYQYEFAGENLAKNFLFSQNVVEAWMKSDSHRENLLKSEYTDVGFAVVNGVLNGEETTLVVQMLGKARESGLAINEEQVTPQAPAGNLAGVSAPRFSWNIYWVFAGFLLATLLSDLYFGTKLHIIRFHGKNTAHIIFLMVVSAGVLFFLTKGAIL